MTGGFFAILDDIALLLDDAAAMSKVAAKKTAGILGDDLAVNAEKATGFKASRELPVLWAITKGSFANKVIILPFAFLLSAFASWLIVPVLLLGGAYLSYEGVEKIYHVLFHRKTKGVSDEAASEEKDPVKLEKEKVKSAVRTDFILSIEIIVIALGTVADKSLILQIVVVSFVALLATVGVYGVVALIVRMDDMGFLLVRTARRMRGVPSMLTLWLGSLLISLLPYTIRGLSILGTVAMLLVGGGMFVHNIEVLHHVVDFLPLLLANLAAGLLVGGLLVGGELVVHRIRH